MLRLTFFFEDSHIELGFSAVMNFFHFYGHEIHQVLMVNDFLIDVFKKMPAAQFNKGFTEDFKQHALQCLERNKGKICLVMDDFFLGGDHERANVFYEGVKRLNEGEDLETVNAFFSQKAKELR